VPEKGAEAILQDGCAVSERWYVPKDGSKFFGSGSVIPYRSEGGSAQGFGMVIRDLTE
jgi:two-component system, chemotaxis family, CheB/CheR fusion protein